MGVQKKNEAQTARWKQVLVVGACILFVGLMILSGMGTGWLTMFSSVKPGDVTVIDYTIYNSAGIPVITSNEQVYKKAVASGTYPLATKQVSVVANKSLGTSLFPVDVYSSNGGSSQFAIFATEYNAISSGLVGMKLNQKKTVALPVTSSMSQIWSAEQLSRNKVNITDVQVGQMFSMGVSDDPQDLATNATAKSYLRLGEITRKTASDIVVDFGYPTADITVLSINSKS
jgi:hypothetical protein